MNPAQSVDIENVRGASLDAVRSLLAMNSAVREFEFFGEHHVNLLKLDKALDTQYRLRTDR